MVCFLIYYPAARRSIAQQLDPGSRCWAARYVGHYHPRRALNGGQMVDKVYPLSDVHPSTADLDVHLLLGERSSSLNVDWLRCERSSGFDGRPC